MREGAIQGSPMGRLHRPEIPQPTGTDFAFKAPTDLYTAMHLIPKLLNGYSGVAINHQNRLLESKGHGRSPIRLEP